MPAILEPPILCRAAFAAPVTPNDEVMFMPAGLQMITPTHGGRPVQIQVIVDRDSADALEEQRQLIVARNGKLPYFDFNHEDRAASFWPKQFVWKKDGVYALGEWSKSGRDGIEGKDWRQFSPVFFVDNVRGKPARIICNEEAKPNMGGLVNDPAFHNILPFWAKNAGASSGAVNPPNKGENPPMTKEEIAALQAKNQELEDEIASLQQQQQALKLKNESDAVVAAKIEAKEAEINANALTLENEQLKANLANSQSEVKARNAADAKAAVSDAVRRGAIPALDSDTQDAWEKDITENPQRAALLAKMPGNPALSGSYVMPRHSATRITRPPTDKSQPAIIGEDPRKVFETLIALSARQAKTASHEQKSELSKTFGAIFSREFKGAQGDRMLDFPLSAILAADSTDTNLGTLAGSLVTQRVLELLKFQFPSLTRFTTDFSDEPASFNQTIMTRIVTVPAVSDYNTSTGWTDSTAATTDVPVKIDKHRGVPITFNSNILASTARRLFDEFAPAQAYALAKDMVDNLYTRITDSNFPSNKVQATSGFARATVASIGTALTLKGVPIGPGARTLLLYSTVFEKLVTDSTLVSFATYQKPQLVTEPQDGVMLVIPVDTFSVINAPNLPTNNGNITGFAGSKSALVIATRTPNDYTTALSGSSFGNVQMVTNPDIGLTVLLVQYVDHKLGTATQRISLMYGTALGQANAGMLLKAAAGSGSSQ
jgi:hypothetical protein